MLQERARVKEPWENWMEAVSGSDRRKIKAAQMQASDQLAILEQGITTFWHL